MANGARMGRLMRLWPWLALLATTWLAGCANVGEARTPFSRPAAVADFEQQHLKEARKQASQGDLAEAAYHWEVLTVLRPDQAEYKQKLAQTREQIERNAIDLMRSARQAQQKGALEEATQRYLAVLALQPDDKAAAQALRAIERERVRREQLGKYSSRQLQPRMPTARKAAPANGVTPAPAPYPPATSTP